MAERSVPHFGADDDKSGVYAIVNVVNNRQYIGAATRFGQRWWTHVRALRNGKHSNPRPSNTTRGERCEGD